jgi:membrane associated rhomboid family serine protease
MKIRYNAPLTLTLVLISFSILLFDIIFQSQLQLSFFAVSRQSVSLANPMSLLLLISHSLGHDDFSHFIANASFLILLGPILEEKYGSLFLLFACVITAVLTGLLHIFLFNSALLGTSGIVFMMILLSSFVNFGSGEIPMTFILIVLVFLSREILNVFAENNISELSHLIGGGLGALLGFLFPREKKEAEAQ